MSSNPAQVAEKIMAEGISWRTSIVVPAASVSKHGDEGQDDKSDTAIGYGQVKTTNPTIFEGRGCGHTQDYTHLGEECQGIEPFRG